MTGQPLEVLANETIDRLSIATANQRKDEVCNNVISDVTQSGPTIDVNRGDVISSCNCQEEGEGGRGLQQRGEGPEVLGGEVLRMSSGRSDGRTRGLLNPAGENNCFLNSTIQVLWHLDSFKRNFSLLHGHICTQNSCIFCALKVIFIQFQYSDQAALPPDALRQALARSFHEEQRFQLGLMDDAAECYENIMSQIHLHSALNTVHNDEDQCFALHCIAHQKFAMSVTEQTYCPECHKSSRSLSFAQIVCYVSTNALESTNEEVRQSDPIPRWNTTGQSQPRQAQAASFGTKVRRRFGQRVYHALNSADNLNCPWSGCGVSVRTRRTISNCPEVVSVGLIWDSDRPSYEQIKNLVDTIDQQLYITDIFDDPENDGGRISRVSVKGKGVGRDIKEKNVGPGQEEEYYLAGVVCYYGKHYSTFLYYKETTNWVSCDDTTVVQIGPRWESVVEKCCRGHYQPLLLLYVRQSLNPINIDDALHQVLISHDHKFRALPCATPRPITAMSRPPSARPATGRTSDSQQSGGTIRTSISAADVQSMSTSGLGNFSEHEGSPRGKQEAKLGGRRGKQQILPDLCRQPSYLQAVSHYYDIEEDEELSSIQFNSNLRRLEKDCHSNGFWNNTCTTRLKTAPHVIRNMSNSLTQSTSDVTTSSPRPALRDQRRSSVEIEVSRNLVHGENDGYVGMLPRNTHDRFNSLSDCRYSKESENMRIKRNPLVSCNDWLLNRSQSVNCSDDNDDALSASNSYISSETVRKVLDSTLSLSHRHKLIKSTRTSCEGSVGHNSERFCGGSTRQQSIKRVIKNFELSYEDQNTHAIKGGDWNSCDTGTEDCNILSTESVDKKSCDMLGGDRSSSSSTSSSLSTGSCASSKDSGYQSTSVDPDRIFVNFPGVGRLPVPIQSPRDRSRPTAHSIEDHDIAIQPVSLLPASNEINLAKEKCEKYMTNKISMGRSSQYRVVPVMKEDSSSDWPCLSSHAIVTSCQTNGDGDSLTSARSCTIDDIEHSDIKPADQQLQNEKQLHKLQQQQQQQQHQLQQEQRKEGQQDLQQDKFLQIVNNRMPDAVVMRTKEETGEILAHLLINQNCLTKNKKKKSVRFCENVSLVACSDDLPPPVDYLEYVESLRRHASCKPTEKPLTSLEAQPSIISINFKQIVQQTTTSLDRAYEPSDPRKINTNIMAERSDRTSVSSAYCDKRLYLPSQVGVPSSFKSSHIVECHSADIELRYCWNENMSPDCDGLEGNVNDMEGSRAIIPEPMMSSKGVIECNLCHSRLVSVMNLYCTDCRFYLSKFEKLPTTVAATTSSTSISS